MLEVKKACEEREKEKGGEVEEGERELMKEVLGLPKGFGGRIPFGCGSLEVIQKKKKKVKENREEEGEEKGEGEEEGESEEEGLEVWECSLCRCLFEVEEKQEEGGEGEGEKKNLSVEPCRHCGLGAVEFVVLG